MLDWNKHLRGGGGDAGSVSWGAWAIPLPSLSEVSACDLCAQHSGDYPDRQSMTALQNFQGPFCMR